MYLSKSFCCPFRYFQMFPGPGRLDRSVDVCSGSNSHGLLPQSCRDADCGNPEHQRTASDPEFATSRRLAGGCATVFPSFHGRVDIILNKKDWNITLLCHKAQKANKRDMCGDVKSLS